MAAGKKQWAQKRRLPKAKSVPVAKRDEENLVDPKLADAEAANATLHLAAQGYDAKLLI